MPNHWRLIVSPPLSGAENMALDHALARSMTHTGVPILRLYRWQPACVSLGYFQASHAVDAEACTRLGLDVVRRPTGGRAILHADELTYAVIAPSTFPGFGRQVIDTYRTISAALLSGLRQLDVPAQWMSPAAVTNGAKSAACFDLPSEYEITVDGRKLIGSAQTRMRGVVLQHGSLLLSVDPALITRVLRLTELSAADLADRMIALDTVVGHAVPYDAAATAMIAGFERHFGLELTPTEPNRDELALMATLLAERYANPTWTNRR